MSTGLVIGVPTLESRPITLDWAFAFKSIHPPINYNTVFSVVKNHPVHIARNMIVEEALRSNAKYLLFIGDDTIPPPHMLRQFIFRMEQDESVGVIGGVYFSKSDPSFPLVFRGNGSGAYWDWKVGEYFEVTGLGMDATMLRMDMVKEMKKPYFHTEDSDQFLDGINNAVMWTEDLWFLRKVKEETQYKIMCDSGVICDHVDVRTGRKYSIPPYSLPTRRLEVKKDLLSVLDIGCGPIYREFPECDKPVRVDINEAWNPDYRCDVRQLPFGMNSFDIVFSSHVLEHFPRAEWEGVLTEWVRVLKPYGELRLVLPNIEWAAERVVRGEIDDNVLNVLYGAQSNKWDFHYNGLTPKRLEVALAKLGLTDFKCENDAGYNMIISARFAGENEGNEIKKILE